MPRMQSILCSVFSKVCTTNLRKKLLMILWVGAAVLTIAMASTAEETAPDPIAAETTSISARELPTAVKRTVDFATDVQPIFVQACYVCHGPDDQSSDYRLDVKASALGGGQIGGSIVPGDSANSPLIHYVAGLNEEMLMPADGERLTAEQIGILRAWIDQGANWPQSADTKVKDKSDFWSFKPIAQVPVPEIRNSEWVRTPIDAFILQRLEEEGMRPSEPADRRTLIRRLTFDLIGLPPTPEEVEAFVADDSPAAYEKLVDRLLASPRYGERWARHWMDVVHFAETHGNDQDRIRKHAWPYRDYLIRSLNEDKPYARFVEEQIAGDALYPDDPQGVVATAFIAAGPWDESSQLNIVDDTVDKKIARSLDRDDMVTTAMQTFVSMTVQCARCHNHKFDPISQKEYYELQAVFAGVDRANRPYDPDSQIAALRKSLVQQKEDLESGREDVLATLLSEPIQNEVAAWEAASANSATSWTVLDPQTFTSTGGATVTKQPDASILFSGTRSEGDTYTIVAETSVQGVTAVRLEVLADDSLPHKGPGRQDNGNLHLSEFRVEAAPRTNPEARQRVALCNPSSDFDQEGWTVAHAIDGKPETAWANYPEVGKSHVAVFQFAQPVHFEGGTIFTFTLDQKQGAHLIGRPRLSVTNAAKPVSVRLPAPVAEAIGTASVVRTPAQKVEIARFLRKSQVEEQLAALPAQQVVYAAASDFVPEQNFTPAKTPRPVHVLRRGDVQNAEEQVGPGTLNCIAGLPGTLEVSDPADESQRRAALAKWFTDPRNALTWRSIVNRVWHYHFGRGIVASPNDFGHMGAMPTHPELLDWLAADFLQQGGSLKRLHKQIVMSAVYQQSSKHNEQYAAVDADNHLLWRMNRSRLDAESVRDAVLQITGKLDLTMGGPSVKHFVEPPGAEMMPLADYASFDVDSPAGCRRSVYRFVFRTLPDPFMDTLDCADASQLTPARNTSVTALQALSMLNNKFMVRQSEHFAARVAAISSDPANQIEAAYKLAFGRAPNEQETVQLTQYAARHGMANACRLLLNSNEFMFVH